MTRRGQSGFTLIELMISIAVVAIITAVAAGVFIGQQRVSNREEDMTFMQSNARLAMERLGWIFRHAGFGCVDSFKKGLRMQGTDPDSGATLTISSVFAATDNSSTGITINPDQTIVSLGFKKIAELNGSYNKNAKVITLKVVDTPSLGVTNFKRYFTFAPYPKDIFFQNMTSLTSWNEGQMKSIQMTRRTSCELRDDGIIQTDIYMVAPIRIKVQNNILMVQNLAYASAVSPDQYWELADGIEDLQFLYTCDNGATWQGTPTDPNGVQGVRVFLLSRSARPDKRYLDVKTYNLAGNQTGPFNDNFHRMLTTTTIWVRNQI